MPDIVYQSKIKITRDFGPLRRAKLPAKSEPVHFGVHGAIAEHYGVQMGGRLKACPTTLDYLIAAAGG